MNWILTLHKMSAANKCSGSRLHVTVMFLRQELQETKRLYPLPPHACKAPAEWVCLMLPFWLLTPWKFIMDSHRL